MPFHHVFVALTPEAEELRCVLADLSEQELRREFLKPYRKGRSIVCGNEFVPTKEIRTLRIIRTPEKSEVEIEKLQQQHYEEVERFNRDSDSAVWIPSAIYGVNEVLEAGEDITSLCVSGPPGDAASGSLVTFLHNPWVVRVGGGLLLLAIVGWLGWR